ncbi:389_t:CDS:2, partial [Acaulospora morrowiae]
MDSPNIHKRWVEDAIRSKHMTEFDYNSFREISIILTTPMADVKKAYQIGFDRNVVLKYLRDDQYKIETEYYKSFSREIRNLTRLNEFDNKNIVRSNEDFETHDYLEYLDSESIVYIDPLLLSTYGRKDESSDSYSLGVLLWEISSGIPFFSDRLNLDKEVLMNELISGSRENP